MVDDDASELEEEIGALRNQVIRLTEAMADCRARSAHQQAVISHLRRELSEAQAGRQAKLPSSGAQT